MRVVFMGSPEFAVPSLKSLHENGHEIVGVYCQPPKPKDRGMHMQKTPVHEAAEQMGLEVLTPKTLRNPDAEDVFKSHRADVAVVAAYGLILPQAILDIPIYGCINIHGSLLPRWRGAAPLQRAIMAGDNKTGITIMQMEAGLDTGPMILMEDLPISSSTTVSSLHDDMADLGAKLITKVLSDIDPYIKNAVQQPEEGVTYAAKVLKPDGFLDFSNQSAQYLDRQIRALNPWPGTWFTHNGTDIKALCGAVFRHDLNDCKLAPGQIARHGDGVLVGCKDQDESLLITRMQKPGGKPMPAADFIRGYDFFKN